MYSDFIKKMSSRLIENEFYTLGVYGDGENISENTNVMLLAKQEGNIFYVVGMVDCQKRDMDDYRIQIGDIINDMYNNLEQIRCTRLICVNIVVGQGADEFVKKIEFYPDEKMAEVWWAIDLESNKIFVPKGHPNKILDIYKFMEDSISDQRVFDNKTIDFKEYEQAVIQNTALEKRTSHTNFTIALVTINILIFAFSLMTGSTHILVDKFALNSQLVMQQHQFYRIITSMFIHLDLAHIMCNCLYLYIFGSRTEKYFGKARFLMIYFFSGIMGCLLSMVFTKGFSAGASGAVYGLLGAVLMLSFVKKKSIDGFDFSTILIIFIPGILLGFLSPQIDVWGHVGGAIGGLISGYVMIKSFSNDISS